MIKVIVDSTNNTTQEFTFKLTDSDGTDWTADFIGAWNGWGNFKNNEDGTYSMSQEDFDFWNEAMEKQKDIDERCAELKSKLSSSQRESLFHTLWKSCSSNDLEDFQNEMISVIEEFENKLKEGK